MSAELFQMSSNTTEQNNPDEKLSSLFIYPASLCGAGSFMCALIGFLLFITMLLFH